MKVRIINNIAVTAPEQYRDNEALASAAPVDRHRAGRVRRAALSYRHLSQQA